MPFWERLTSRWTALAFGLLIVALCPWRLWTCDRHRLWRHHHHGFGLCHRVPGALVLCMLLVDSMSSGCCCEQNSHMLSGPVVLLDGGGCLCGTSLPCGDLALDCQGHLCVRQKLRDASSHATRFLWSVAVSSSCWLHWEAVLWSSQYHHNLNNDRMWRDATEQSVVFQLWITRPSMGHTLPNGRHSWGVLCHDYDLAPFQNTTDLKALLEDTDSMARGAALAAEMRNTDPLKNFQ